MALLDLRLDRLDDHDRVVDDEADGEDEAQERQRVGREADHREEHEGAHQGHRNGEDGDQGGPPALQEDEHHEDDEPDRLEQRDDDLLRALGHGDRRVERQADLHVGWKPLGEARHGRFCPVGRFERVRAGDLVQADERRR